MNEMRLHYNVVCVGAGGTGGNFLKEFGRFMSFFKEENKKITLSIVDGDRIEEKNCERQPFLLSDQKQFKSVILAGAIVENFNLDEKKVKAYTGYISNIADLDDIVRASNIYSESSRMSKDITILIGAVDNHRARQVMNEYFYISENIVYIDSANEYHVGEVCTGIRLKGINLAPPRSYYYPDILDDRTPSKAEISCGTINVSSPQHITTNLMAANICLCTVVKVINSKLPKGGRVFFDSNKMFARFDEFDDSMLEKEYTNEKLVK